MHQHPGRAVDGQGYRVGNGMVDVDELNIHAAHADVGARGGYVEVGRGG